MLKGMIRGATLLVGLATAMTAMTAAAQKKITVPAGTRILVRMFRFDRFQQTTGWVSVHWQPGDKSASRQCGGSAKRHPCLWRSCYGLICRQNERQF